MTRDEVREYLEASFPQVFGGNTLRVESAEEGRATLRLTPDESHLRPGGVVSGPTLMMLADACAYAALLSLSTNAKMAVTSNLNVTFLRGATLGEDIVQTAEVIRSGRRLSVIVCEAFGGDGARLLAHATMTYAMPAAG